MRHPGFLSFYSVVVLLFTLVALTSGTTHAADNEEYSTRPDILTLNPTEHPELGSNWVSLRKAHLETAAMLVEMYPDYEVYFLARDAELMSDTIRVLLKLHPELSKRFHILNLSRLNMNDPHAKQYLAQEGISLEALKNGKKFLLFDTGFMGSIPAKVQTYFPPELSPFIQTHLITSANPNHPSTRIFLTEINAAASALIPGNFHGTIVNYEHMARFTDRSNHYEFKNGIWVPMSPKVASTHDGQVSKEQALKYMEDLLFYLESESANGDFERSRKVWREMREAALNKDPQVLNNFITEFLLAHKLSPWSEAVVRDFLEMGQTNNPLRLTHVPSPESFGLTPTGDSSKYGLEKKLLLTKHPDWAALLADPATAVHSLFASKDYQTLGSLIDALNDMEFFINLAEKLAGEPLSPHVEGLVEAVIKKNNPLILEQFAGITFAKNKGWLDYFIDHGNSEVHAAIATHSFSKPSTETFGAALSKFISKAGPASQALLVQHAFTKPHAAAWKKQLESLIAHGSEEVRSALVQHVATLPILAQDPDLLQHLIEQASEENLYKLLVAFYQTKAPPSQAAMQQIVETKPEQMSERNVKMLGYVLNNFPEWGDFRVSLFGLLMEQPYLDPILKEREKKEAFLKILTDRIYTPSHLPRLFQQIASIETGVQRARHFQRAFQVPLKLASFMLSDRYKAVIHQRAMEGTAEQRVHLIETVFGRPHAFQMKNTLEYLIDHGQPEVLNAIAQHTFSQPIAKGESKLLARLIEKGNDQVLQMLVREGFNFDHLRGESEELKRLIAKADQKTLQNLATNVLSRDHMSDLERLLLLMIERADQETLAVIAEHVLSKTHTEKMERVVRAYVAKAEEPALAVLAKYGFSKAHSVHWTKALSEAIAKSGQTALESFGEHAFSQPHAEAWETQLNEALTKSGKEAVSIFVKHTFSTAHGLKQTSALTHVIEKIEKEADLSSLQSSLYESRLTETLFQVLQQIIETKPDQMTDQNVKWLLHVVKNKSLSDQQRKTLLRLLMEQPYLDSVLADREMAAYFQKEGIDRLYSEGRALTHAMKTARSADRARKLRGSTPPVDPVALSERYKAEIHRRAVEGTPEQRIHLAETVLNRPHAFQMPKTIKYLIEQGDPKILEAIAEHTFTQLESGGHADLLAQLIAQGEGDTLNTLVTHGFVYPHLNSASKELKALILKADQRTLQNLAANVLSQGKMHDEEKLLLLAIERADQETLKQIATHVLSQPFAENMEKVVLAYVEKAGEEALVALAVHGFSKSHSEKWHLALTKAIAKAGQPSLQAFAEHAFSQTHAAGWEPQLNAALTKANSETIRVFVTHTFSKSHALSMPLASEHLIEKIADKDDLATLLSSYNQLKTEDLILRMRQIIETKPDQIDYNNVLWILSVLTWKVEENERIALLRLLLEQPYLDPMLADGDRKKNLGLAFTKNAYSQNAKRITQALAMGDRAQRAHFFYSTLGKAETVIVTDRYKKEIYQRATQGGPEDRVHLAETVFNRPHGFQMLDTLQYLIQYGELPVLKVLAQYAYARPESMVAFPLLKTLIERGDDSVLETLVDKAINFPHFSEATELISAVIAKAGQSVLKKIATEILSRPHLKDAERLLLELIARADSSTLAIVAEKTLASKSSADFTAAAEAWAKRADDSTRTLGAQHIFSQPHSVAMSAAVTYLSEYGNQNVLKALSTYAFTQPHSAQWPLAFQKISERAEGEALSAAIKFGVAQGTGFHSTQAMINLMHRAKGDEVGWLIWAATRIPNNTEKLAFFQYVIEKKGGQLNKDQLRILVQSISNSSLENLSKAALVRLLFEQKYMDEILKTDFATLIRQELYSISHGTELQRAATRTEAEARREYLVKSLPATTILPPETYPSPVGPAVSGLAGMDSGTSLHAPASILTSAVEGATSNVHAAEYPPEPVNVETAHAETLAVNELAPGTVISRGGASYTILKKVDEGTHSRVYKVRSSNGIFYSLELARDADQETAESFEREPKKISKLQELNVAHADLLYFGKDFQVKEWIEGTRGDKWLASWASAGANSKAEELLALIALLKKLSFAKAYVGDLNPQNVVWSPSQHDWFIVDAGSVRSRATVEEVVNRYLENVSRRWGRVSGSCNDEFEQVLKTELVGAH